MAEEKINNGEWMYELREKWMNLCASGRDIQWLEAQKCIQWLYAAGKLKKPSVIFADSPLSAYYAAVALLSSGPEDLKAIDWLVQTYEYIESHRLSHLYDIWLNAAESERYRRWNHPVRNFWRIVRQDIIRRVFGCMLEEDTVSEAFKRLQCVNTHGALEPVETGGNTLCAWREKDVLMDMPWGAFYKLCRKLFCFPNRYYGTFLHLVESGMYDLILLDGVCIMVPFPAVIKRNEQGQMHSEEGPALAWKDDYALYFLHGLHLEKELWQKIASRAMTPQEILSIKNQEIRHVAIRIYGYEKIIDTCAKILSQSEKGQVIEVDLADDGYNVPARFVKVTCPSTNREFLLRVDPRLEQTKDVVGALAWTADMTPEDYVFLAET